MSMWKGKYIISSVQKGAIVNKEFYRNMKAFARDNDVDNIFVFLMNGKYKDIDDIDEVIQTDPDIRIITNETLNDSLRCFDSKFLPQRVDPFLWLAEKISQNFSYIVPSAKVRYQAVGNYPNKPRCFMATGALTNPSYKTHTAMGVKAEAQHQLGFIYVNVRDNKRFDPIPVMGTKKGTFHFLDQKYSAGTQKIEQVESMILWDWHNWDTCPYIRKKTIKLLERYTPKTAVFHDLFNWHAINHHEEGDSIALQRRVSDKRDSLQNELKECYKEVKYFCERFPDIEFKVVYSNHDDFLRQYVAHDKHIKDFKNREFGEDLRRNLVIRWTVPLQEALSMIGELPKNIQFLDIDESCKRRWVELWVHGHKGTNGSRGSPNQFKKLNLKTITGHTHSPQLYSNWMVVWTSTILNPDYTKWGVSSWLNAHGFLYKDWNYTLYTIIK